MLFKLTSSHSAVRVAPNSQNEASRLVAKSESEKKNFYSNPDWVVNLIVLPHRFPADDRGSRELFGSRLERCENFSFLLFSQAEPGAFFLLSILALRALLECNSCALPIGEFQRALVARGKFEMLIYFQFCVLCLRVKYMDYLAGGANEQKSRLFGGQICIDKMRSSTVETRSSKGLINRV